MFWSPRSLTLALLPLPLDPPMPSPESGQRHIQTILGMGYSCSSGGGPQGSQSPPGLALLYKSGTVAWPAECCHQAGCEKLNFTLGVLAPLNTCACSCGFRPVISLGLVHRSI